MELSDSDKAKRYETAIKFAAEEFLCPITKGLPVDPVTAEDGRIYERSAIEEHIRTRRDDLMSPSTNEPMGRKLLPAVQVRNSIKALVESGTIEEGLATQWEERIRIDDLVEKMRKKAEEGDTDAMCDLGDWYFYGKNDLPQDEERAYQWYKKAADLRSVHGMAMEGCLLSDGDGVEENKTYGAALVAMAATLGSDVGAYYMGEFYMKGLHVRGFPLDKVKAKYWLLKVADGNCSVKHLCEDGVEHAKEMLDKLDE